MSALQLNDPLAVAQAALPLLENSLNAAEERHATVATQLAEARSIVDATLAELNSARAALTAAQERLERAVEADERAAQSVTEAESEETSAKQVLESTRRTLEELRGSIERVNQGSSVREIILPVSVVLEVLGHRQKIVHEIKAEPEDDSGELCLLRQDGASNEPISLPSSEPTPIANSEQPQRSGAAPETRHPSTSTSEGATSEQDEPALLRWRRRRNANSKTCAAAEPPTATGEVTSTPVERTQTPERSEKDTNAPPPACFTPTKNALPFTTLATPSRQITSSPAAGDANSRSTSLSSGADQEQLASYDAERPVGAATRLKTSAQAFQLSQVRRRTPSAALGMTSSPAGSKRARDPASDLPRQTSESSRNAKQRRVDS